MEALGIGKFNTINEFVNDKLTRFEKCDKTFLNLFKFMFSEKDNIMYEYSEGYKINKVTYKESYNSILKRCSTLKSLLSEYENDSVVGLYLDNSLDWIEIFWSIILCGYRPLLLNLRLSDDLLYKALKDTKAVAVISKDKSFELNTIKVESIIASENIYSPSFTGSELFIMSSGTTNSIKLCAYSAKEMYYQIRDSYEIIIKCKRIKKHYEGNLKLLTFLPFYHIFGLVAVYIWFSFFSRTFVQLNNLAPQTILNTIKRHKVTHIFSVPMFWETIYSQTIKTIKARGEKTYNKYLKGMKISKTLFSFPRLHDFFTKKAFKEIRTNLFGDSIVFLISGGSCISNEVLSFFNLIGYHLANGYGMTEIGITSVELTRDKKYLLDGYVGTPLTFAQYKRNEKGELLVKGDATAKYIIENGKTTDNNDWYNTHDLFEENNNHYKILGRKDDIIISSTGENLNPNLIEPYYLIDNIDRACLINSTINGKDTPVLLLSTKGNLSAEEFFNLKTKINKISSDINFTTDHIIKYISSPLIQGDEFKLNRARIKKDFENNLLKEYSSLSNSDQIDNELINEISAFFSIALDKDQNDISYDSDFFLSEGGSSLCYYEMISSLEQHYQITIPSEQFEKLRTINDFYNYITTEK